MGKPTVSSLKKKADKIFSQYIRLRDADSNGYLDCITCNKTLLWKEAHAGHFVSRRVNSLRFWETNVNGQCSRCNTYGAGEQFAYAKALDLKYGDNTANELHSRRWETHKFTIPELEVIIEEYKQLVKEMENADL